MKQLEGQAWRTVLSQHLGCKFQASLAKAANLSGRTVQNILKRGNPSGSTLESIAKALGIAKWELLKEVEDLVQVSKDGFPSAPITDSTNPIEQKSSDSAGISDDTDSANSVK